MHENICIEPIRIQSGWYEKIFDHSHDAVFGVSATGEILQVNSVFTSMFGYQQNIADGANISLFISDAFGGVSFEFYSKKLSQVGDVFIHNFSGIRLDGELFPIQMAMTQVSYESNLCFILSVRDESFKEKTRNELEHHEFMLRQSQHYAGIGHWHYDFCSQQFDFSKGAKRLLNIYSVGSKVKLSALLQLIDSEDKEKLPKAIASCLKGDKIDEQIKVLRSDGDIIWIQFQGNIEFDHGSPMNIHGVLQDITQRKKVEFKEASLGFIVKHSLDEIFIFDCEKLQFIEMNELVLNSWGYEKEQLRSMYCFDVLHEFDKKSLARVLAPLLSGDEKSVSFQAQLQCKNTEHYLLELKIKKMQYAEKNVFVAFANDVTEREKLVDDSYKAKEEAERENKAKSEFLSRMSHELRTPMNAIMGFSQLMDADDESSLTVEQQDNLNEITKASTHLLTLMNEILDLSRIEAGRVSISLEDINISELVSDVCLLAVPIAENYGVKLTNSLKSDLYVQGDRVRLKQVLLNFVSNGIKYGGAGGVVSISFYINRLGQGVIEVEDKGSGIAEEKLQDLFIPFERLGAEITQTEGTGIGLTIAKQMVQLMHGELGVSSQLGVGSCFWVSLPLGKESVRKREVINKNREPVRLNNIGNKSILYIEDNPANLKLVDRLLSRYTNCHFFYAPTASLGLELAKAHQPDLILMDIHLPGISGVQAKKLMEDDAELVNIPVIAISASALTEDFEKAKQAGFVDYIVKPFEINSFIKKANKYLL